MDVDDFVLVESRHHVVPDLIKDGWVCWDRVELDEKKLHKDTQPASKDKSKKRKRAKRKKPLK